MIITPQRHWTPGGRLAAVLMLLASTVSVGIAHASPLHDTMTLHGVVQTRTGRPVPNASLLIDNVATTADSSGSYSITFPSTRDNLVVLWAPGYSERILNLSLSSSGGTIGFNFSGQFGLSRANVNSLYGARLRHLPSVVPAGTASVTFTGTSAVRLQRTFAVEDPTHRVKRYPLRIHGHAFTGTLTFPSNGQFRVEINSSAAISIFNVTVFHGSTPQLSTFYPLNPDPSTLSDAAVAKLMVRELNIVRRGLLLPKVRGNTRLAAAAQSHTVEMVRYGYASTHPHIGIHGSTIGQRIAAAGFRGKSAEDIGIAPTTRMALLGLLHSPIHLRNIEGSYRYVGVGVVHSGGNYYFTLDFAR